jgi:predicted dehydrogenase
LRLKASYTLVLGEESGRNEKSLGLGLSEQDFGVEIMREFFTELKETELLAVCDIDAERAKAVAKQFGVKACTSTAKMLKRKDIEAVSVCTWSTSLAKEALKALKAGKHVLVEKPMAANSKQAENLLKTAEKRGITSFCRLFNAFLSLVFNILGKLS